MDGVHSYMSYQLFEHLNMITEIDTSGSLFQKIFKLFGLYHHINLEL